jgi:hypothetical protein
MHPSTRSNVRRDPNALHVRKTRCLQRIIAAEAAIETVKYVLHDVNDELASDEPDMSIVSHSLAVVGSAITMASATLREKVQELASMIDTDHHLAGCSKQKQFGARKARHLQSLALADEALEGASEALRTVKDMLNADEILETSFAGLRKLKEMQAADETPREVKEILTAHGFLETVSAGLGEAKEMMTPATIAHAAECTLDEVITHVALANSTIKPNIIKLANMIKLDPNFNVGGFSTSECVARGLAVDAWNKIPGHGSTERTMILALEHYISDDGITNLVVLVNHNHRLRERKRSASATTSSSAPKQAKVKKTEVQQA